MNLKGLELHKSSVLSALKTLDTFLLTASEEMLAVILLFKNNEKSISENDQTTKDQKEDKESKVHGPKKDDAKATKRDQKEEKESKVDGPKKKYPKASKGDVMDSGSDTNGVTRDDENGAEKSRKNRRRRGKSIPYLCLSEKKKLQIANRKAEAKKRRESRLSKGTSIEAV